MLKTNIYSYKKDRKIKRPNIIWPSLFFCLLLFTSFFLECLLLFCITYYFKQRITTILVIESISFIFIVELIIFSRPIFINLILLYQHYASEATRRKCVCHPSCSVYALITFRKYNVFKAIHKTYKRLCLCSSRNKIIIDYP